MKLIITTFKQHDFDDSFPVYAGVRRVLEFKSFSKMYSYLLAEYKQAKLTGDFIQVKSIVKGVRNNHE